MRLDRQPAVVLSFRQPELAGSRNARSGVRPDLGRLTNFAFMLLVLALAALWLVFPPAQLSSASPQASLAQDLPAQTASR